MAAHWKWISKDLQQEAKENPGILMENLDGLIDALDKIGEGWKRDGRTDIAFELKNVRDRLSSGAPLLEKTIRSMIEG